VTGLPYISIARELRPGKSEPIVGASTSPSIDRGAAFGYVAVSGSLVEEPPTLGPGNSPLRAWRYLNVGSYRE
jgi:hypothetical protein